jgi:hypothetical protein
MHAAAVAVPAALAALLALAPLPAAAETIGGNPGPAHNYVCPHADGQGATDCYLDAVEHLYTMCRNVKAIEILTFGYEDSLEGVNAAKYESCVEKQKHNMEKPYKAALKDARRSKPLSDALRDLHDAWAAALTRIRWNRGESDPDYKARVGAAYEGFRERIGRIRVMVADAGSKASPIASAHAAPAAKAAAKPAPRKAPAKGPAAASKGTARPATAASDKAPQS